MLKGKVGDFESHFKRLDCHNGCHAHKCLTVLFAGEVTMDSMKSPCHHHTSRRYGRLTVSIVAVTNDFRKCVGQQSFEHASYQFSQWQAFQ